MCDAGADAVVPELLRTRFAGAGAGAEKSEPASDPDASSS